MAQRRKSENGAVATLISFMSLALIGITALAIDIGATRSKRFDLQVASDAGALAGVDVLFRDPNPLPETIINTAQRIAAANAPNANIQATLGRWTGSTFLTGNGIIPNAVRVVAQEPVSMVFARVWQITSMRPWAEAIAMIGKADDATCVIPFGIEENVIRNAHYGETLHVSRASAGNWGKLDIDGNMSSGNAFYNAMVSGLCNETVSIGDRISPGTGFAKVVDGFEARALQKNTVVIPIVTGFSSGNSQQVVVQGFIVAKLLLQGQGRGAKWSGQIQFLEDFAGTTTRGSAGEPYAQNRSLVR